MFRLLISGKVMILKIIFLLIVFKYVDKDITIVNDYSESDIIFITIYGASHLDVKSIVKNVYCG